MFWKFNLLTSHIDTLLDKEDITLNEILDEDDVLQECKSQNKRLIDFLTAPANIEELVNYITQEPSDETDEKIRYKYPNTACELLISDVSQITEKLSGDSVLMGKVYAFLEGEGPLNPLLASFFSKVMGLLISRKSEMMLEFLQSKEDFVGHLLRHLGTSAIMDLLLRLITCIESSECHMRCLSWLSQMQLIQKLVGLIDPAQPEEKHCNACQSLCDIIRLSREQMSQLQEKADPDPLLSAVESEDIIQDLLHHMFDGERVESVLVNGITVIQNLLEFKRVGMFLFHSPDGGSEPITSLDAERLAHSVSNTVRALTPRLKDFHDILVNPPKQHYTPMNTTVGELNPPFGNTRLQTAKLITSLLFTKTESVNTELARLGTLGVLVDLCFSYKWNNFLHTQVEQSLSTILGSNLGDGDAQGDKDNPLLNQLLKEYKIMEKIIGVWQENDQLQARPGGHRCGYMGHLTRIANHVTGNLEKGPNSKKIRSYFDELPQEAQEKWNAFVAGSLADINKQNTVELVSMAGGHNIYSSSEDDDPEFRDIAFPQDTAMQQAFADYQLQQMTSNFIDQFGFNEEDFGESEERISEKFKERISSINFNINTDEITNARTLFDQVCNERIQQFDEQESEEDLWEEKEITFSQNADSRQNRLSDGREAVTAPTASVDSEDEQSDSSDSEEELDSPRRILQAPTAVDLESSSPANTNSTSAPEHMDVDSSDNWANFDDITMETGNALSATDPGPQPWSENTSASNKTDDSANFESNSSQNTNSWADFSNISQSGPVTSEVDERSRSPVAMDTNESSNTSSRTAAYLVSSAPADLASVISTLVDPPNTEAVVGGTTPDGPDTPAAVAPMASTISDISTTPTEGESPPESDSLLHKAMPISDEPSSETVPQIPPMPEQPVIMENTSDSTAQNSESSEATVIKDKKDESTSNYETMDDEYDDDLADNFNFLAASGLLKSVPDAAKVEPIETDDAQTESNKLEQMRAEAQKAMEQFASETASPGKSEQNGPV